MILPLFIGSWKDPMLTLSQTKKEKGQTLAACLTISKQEENIFKEWLLFNLKNQVTILRPTI